MREGTLGLLWDSGRFALSYFSEDAIDLYADRNPETAIRRTTRDIGDRAHMKEILKEDRFRLISDGDKAFMMAFNDRMAKLGYDFGGKIGSGFVWGKHMVIYRKSETKNKKVFARIYIRKDDSIDLRLFFSKIDRHRAYIENSPDHIKMPFAGDYGDCQHCHNEKDGICRFRKTYTLEGRQIEKCNGTTFLFPKPRTERITDYVNLFTEFYPGRKQGRKQTTR